MNEERERVVTRHKGKRKERQTRGPLSSASFVVLLVWPKPRYINSTFEGVEGALDIPLPRLSFLSFYLITMTIHSILEAFSFFLASLLLLLFLLLLLMFFPFPSHTPTDTYTFTLHTRTSHPVLSPALPFSIPSVSCLFLVANTNRLRCRSK